MTDVQIRRALLDDADELRALIAEEWAPPPSAEVRELLRSLPPSHAVFVAESDGRVVGCIHVHVAHRLTGGRRAQLAALSVAEETQGQGVGTKLVRTAE